MQDKIFRVDYPDLIECHSISGFILCKAREDALAQCLEVYSQTKAEKWMIIDIDDEEYDKKFNAYLISGVPQ